MTRVGTVTIVGTLESVSAREIAVRRRDGELVRLAADLVTHARLVPPTPAQRVAVIDLERLMVDGWRPVETDRFGDWVLRAAGGFTSRANSALAVGDPGV